MSPQNQSLQNVAATDRRTFLRRASLAGLTGSLLPAAGALLAPSRADALPAPAYLHDIAVLNFALNLEYLEAEYYLRGYTGEGLEASGVSLTGRVGDGGSQGAAGSIIVKPGSTKTPFATPELAEYVAEIAEEQRNHVVFLRDTLAGINDNGMYQVALPTLDLYNSFNSLATLLGLGLSSFDPFVSEVNFLIGAFIFEDVGVTAYHGAAAQLSDKGYLTAAAGILAVEAYHASAIRTLLYGLSKQPDDPNAPAGSVPNSQIIAVVQAISDLRDRLSYPNGKKDADQGIQIDGSANIVPADENSIAFARGTKRVLRIVYAKSALGSGGTIGGGFFPDGMNGEVR